MPSRSGQRRCAPALPAGAEQPLVHDHERAAGTDDLRLRFEATNHLGDDEKRLVREVIESILLSREAKRWAHAS